MCKIPHFPLPTTCPEQRLTPTKRDQHIEALLSLGTPQYPKLLIEWIHSSSIKAAENAAYLCTHLPPNALTFVVYYFQNNIATDAQKSLRSLLVSIKISQPAVEIPEGVFYSMKNFNLYVEKKNAETGMLYHTIIYKVDQGFDRAQIVLADSARIELTADKMHMRLTLWDGEQFQNLKSDNMTVFKSQGVPYDRETFNYKQLIFDFDSNFNELEANQFADIPQAKNMRELNHYVDSVNHLIDSSAVAYFNGISTVQVYGAKPLSRKDSLAAVRNFEQHPVSFDKLLKTWKEDKLIPARLTAWRVG